ncbi:MAG: excinuclease ABC subunit C, partial [Candidatus Paceibacterota bacterium]
IRGQVEKLKSVFENAKIIHEIFGREKILIDLQKSLSLPRLPRRIEGYDISNIQGLFATGSMVVFTDGRMDKNEYRKFKIRATDSPNDVAMLKEVLTRRFRHGEWIYPDLILIDGGKPQLNAALSVLNSIKTNIPVVALTKDDKHKGDHIYARAIKNRISLKDISDSAKNLLLQIDSEAHRFAISYYRKLHKELK